VRRWPVLLAMTMATVFLAGCCFLGFLGRGNGRANVAIAAEDDGRTIHVARGDTLTLTLESNPTTGYTWELSAGDPGVLAQVGEPEYRPDPTTRGMMGAGGVAVFRFAVLRKGKTPLRLSYHRPWEKGQEPLRVFSVEIVVR